MPSPTTEKLHELASGLELRPPEQIVEILINAQIAAAHATLPALGAIAEGAEAMARCLSAGGTLYYVGAGSSGLLAATDALELGGTFGIPPERVRILMAGGMPVTSAMPGATEDDTAGLEAGLADLQSGDVVIAVASSGTTPYTLSAARMAKPRGAIVIGMANNPDTPLLDMSDIAILLATPPEVVAGSTRMGAGTAQKIALNAMSTMMGVALGHIHNGMMVNVVADNAKLRNRATSMIAAIAEVDQEVASRCLGDSGGEVKTAVLIAAGAGSAASARNLLDTNTGNLHQALARLRGA